METLHTSTEFQFVGVRLLIFCHAVGRRYVMQMRTIGERAKNVWRSSTECLSTSLSKGRNGSFESSTERTLLCLSTFFLRVHQRCCHLSDARTCVCVRLRVNVNVELNGKVSREFSVCIVAISSETEKSHRLCTRLLFIHGIVAASWMSLFARKTTTPTKKDCFCSIAKCLT